MTHFLVMGSGSIGRRHADNLALGGRPWWGGAELDLCHEFDLATWYCGGLGVDFARMERLTDLEIQSSVTAVAVVGMMAIRTGDERGVQSLQDGELSTRLAVDVRREGASV